MENKQTAVDFLWEEMQEFIAYCGTHALANELNAKYLKAKEMAKEQIIDAHFQGGKKAIMIVNSYIPTPKTMKNIADIENGSLRYDDGYDYYNETFKSE